MTKRTSFFLSAVLAVLTLAACNAGRSAPDPAAIAPLGAPRPPASGNVVRLPEGSGCAAAVAKWRAIQENDHATGHVNAGVYAQIQGEIAEAERACAAGEDARAVSLVRASKARHGYPG